MKNMKKLVILLAFICCAVTMQADSVKFLEDGKEWVYEFTNPIAENQVRYVISGDTVINGVACKRLVIYGKHHWEYRTDDGKPFYKGALYEDGQKVYFFRPETTEAVLLYDFGLSVGDKAVVAGFDPFKEKMEVLVTGERTVVVNGHNLRLLQFTSDFGTSDGSYSYGGWWLEGAGGRTNLIPVSNALCWYWDELRSVTLDGEPVDVFKILRNQENGNRMAYRPFLSDNKQWRYTFYHFEEYEDENGEKNYEEQAFDEKYFLKGDTVINGQTWRKMYYQIADRTPVYEGAWREEGKKVFRILKGENLTGLIYDFNMLTSEFTKEGGPTDFLYFTKVDTIEVGGVQYLRHYFHDRLQPQAVYYNVEGIGGMGGVMPFPPAIPTCICDYSEFLGVYEGGECIFRPEDFTKEAYTGTTEEYVKMLSVGSTWNYDYCPELCSYEITEKSSQDGNSQEYYTVNWYVDRMAAKPDGFMQKNKYNFGQSATFQLREAEGKVYAEKDSYMSFLKEVFQIDDTDLYLKEAGNGEILLYDFTLQAGDRYPCKGDVTVSEVGEMTTRDGFVRKKFTLSNGLQIIEGVGCINSQGEIIAYQNVVPSADGTEQLKTTLSSYNTAEQGVFRGGDEDPNHQRKMLLSKRGWNFFEGNTASTSNYVSYTVLDSYQQYISSDKREGYTIVERNRWNNERQTRVPALQYLHFREADGKVMVPRDEYEMMMADYLGDTPAGEFFIEANGEDEVLLYDFTLQEGDRYPCKGDVVVSSVEDRVMRDGFPRNGLVLIEGIGCINSPYDFYGYQNATTANTLGDEYASGSLLLSVNESEVEPRRILFEIEDEKTSGIQHNNSTVQRSNSSTVYDLQGRKMKNEKVKSKNDRALPKGIYIVNGKKVVVR